MDGPYIRVEDSGLMMPLREDVTTIGRGRSVDVHLSDPTVSRLHAEIVRRGPYAYVSDLGLSRNGTRVNGRLVARRLLEDGDVMSFGAARCRVFGITLEDFTAEAELRRPSAPELTRRELDVLTSLCRPALSDEAFVSPATAREIAADLVVTEAAVKQHLLRLYQKFRIPEGANRRVRLANEVVALGIVRPLPPTDRSHQAGADQRADRRGAAADGDRRVSVTSGDREASAANGDRRAALANGDRKPVPGADRRTTMTSRDRRTPLAGSDRHTPLAGGDRRTRRTDRDRRTPLADDDRRAAPPVVPAAAHRRRAS
jgi:FHA domain-containing protein